MSYMHKLISWPLLAFPGGRHFVLVLSNLFFSLSQFISHIIKKNEQWDFHIKSIYMVM
jgi:hypothetical protein